MQPSSNPLNIPSATGQQYSQPSQNAMPPNFNAQLTTTGEMSMDKSNGQAMSLTKMGYPMAPIPFDVTAQQQGQQGQQGQHQRKNARQKTPKIKIMPPDLEIEGPSSNAAYQAALIDPQLTVSPQALGFLPSNYWLNLDSTFGDLVTKFFQRKNNANCRFPHKLYNALAIVDQDPKMYNLLGVRWVTDTVFKVDKLIFGRVLGISSIDGGLFHRQGNFPSHGFCELNPNELAEVKTSYDVTDVDQDRIRLMHHIGHMFSKQSDEESVNKCKWSACDIKE